MLLVLTTVPSERDAELLAELIISAKIAACIQIIPGIRSIYLWEGRVMKESECLLLIKTLEQKYPELEAFITANHKYEVPEIVAINADKVSEPYSKWMMGCIAPD